MNSIKIYVEGNIGAGKSEFIKSLDIDKYKVVQEPVDIWEQIGILSEFYKDPKRWAYTFQSLAFATRLSTVWTELVNNPLNKPVILERSIYTDKNCFTKLQVEFQNMNEIEYKTYLAWYALTEHKFAKDIKADAIIYLRTTPEICMERIKKRSRNGESSISMEYLTALHNKHEEWLTDHVNVIVIDVSKDMDEIEYKQFVEENITNIIKKIKDSKPNQIGAWYDAGI